MTHEEALAHIGSYRAKLAALPEGVLVSRLRKTLNSINAHIARGGTNTSQRGMELVDRYDDLRKALIGEGGYSPAWLAYCDSIGADRSHRGFDFFC